MPTIISGDTGVNQITAGAIERADLPAGSVIQVVQKQVTTKYSTSNSDAWQSAGDFNFAITPSSASSIIVGLYSIYGYCDHSGGGVSNLALRIQRNGSTTVKETNVLVRYVTDGYRTDLAAATSFNFVDSPGSTSSTNYVFNYRANLGNVDCGLNRMYAFTTEFGFQIASHLILLEIAS